MATMDFTKPERQRPTGGYMTNTGMVFNKVDMALQLARLAASKTTYDDDYNVGSGNWPPPDCITGLDQFDHPKYRISYNFCIEIERIVQALPGGRGPGPQPIPCLAEQWKYIRRIFLAGGQARGGSNVDSFQSAYSKDKRIMLDLLKKKSVRYIGRPFEGGRDGEEHRTPAAAEDIEVEVRNEILVFSPASGAPSSLPAPFPPNTQQIDGDVVMIRNTQRGFTLIINYEPHVAQGRSAEMTADERKIEDLENVLAAVQGEIAILKQRQGQ